MEKEEYFFMYCIRTRKNKIKVIRFHKKDSTEYKDIFAIPVNEVSYGEICHNGTFGEKGIIMCACYWKHHDDTDFDFKKEQFIYPQDISVDGETWSKYPVFAEGVTKADSFSSVRFWNNIDDDATFTILDDEEEYGLGELVVYPKEMYKNMEARPDRLKLFKADVPTDENGVAGGTMLFIDYAMYVDVPTRQLYYPRDTLYFQYRDEDHKLKELHI